MNRLEGSRISSRRIPGLQSANPVPLCAYRGANCNNSAGNVGPFYVNLNNTASNTNWNIGAAHSI